MTLTLTHSRINHVPEQATMNKWWETLDWPTKNRLHASYCRAYKLPMMTVLSDAAIKQLYTQNVGPNNRQKAMIWWRTLTQEQRDYATRMYREEFNLSDDIPMSGHGIEHIYNKEGKS